MGFDFPNHGGNVLAHGTGKGFRYISRVVRAPDDEKGSRVIDARTPSVYRCVRMVRVWECFRE